MWVPDPNSEHALGWRDSLPIYVRQMKEAVALSLLPDLFQCRRPSDCCGRIRYQIYFRSLEVLMSHVHDNNWPVCPFSFQWLVFFVALVLNTSFYSAHTLCLPDQQRASAYLIAANKLPWNPNVRRWNWSRGCRGSCTWKHSGFLQVFMFSVLSGAKGRSLQMKEAGLVCGRIGYLKVNQPINP